MQLPISLMRTLQLTILTMCLLLCFEPAEAQIWPFRKKSSAKKATRDLEKRRQEANPEEVFNPVQQMGAGDHRERTDYIWSASSAATSYKNAGNLSITSPSRLGIGANMELSSWMALNYYAPNLFVKKEHLRKKWHLSTLHGIYSATPGLSYAKNGGDTFLADSLTNAPLIISIKNQIIISRPFYNTLNCNTGQPYLILSGGVAFDFGIPFGDEEIFIPREHLIAPRSEAYSAKGWLITAHVHADWELTSSIIGRATIRMLNSSSTVTPAFEQQTSIEVFFSRHFSGSLGYLLSAGSFDQGTFKIWPFLDICYYFGKKKERERELFKRKLF